MTEQPPPPDLIEGVSAIAAVLGVSKRRVLYLKEIGELPVFNLGRAVCARRSTLIAWFAEREAAALRKAAP